MNSKPSENFGIEVVNTKKGGRVYSIGSTWANLVNMVNTILFEHTVKHMQSNKTGQMEHIMHIRKFTEQLEPEPFGTVEQITTAAPL